MFLNKVILSGGRVKTTICITDVEICSIGIVISKYEWLIVSVENSVFFSTTWFI